MSAGFHRLKTNTTPIPGINLVEPKGLPTFSRVPSITKVEQKPQPPAIDATLLDVKVHQDGPMINPARARQMGFTGDACDHCGSMKMQIAGHCTVCRDCGTTTGCS